MKKVLGAALATLLVSCGAPTPAEELCLGALESSLNVCPGASTVPGIDVSYYQGTVNWAAVKASGQKFAIARVSDGLNYPDSKFVTNWQAIKAQGLVRGTYQFFRPAQDPLAQANFLLSRVAAAGGFAADDLPAVLDVESADGQSPAVIQAKMRIWLNRVEAVTGKKPIIYTAAFMASNIGTSFSAYTLWVANYGATCPLMPTGWAQWKMWQHSSTGSVAGISGNVDLNKWNGTLAQLIAYVAPGAPPDAGVKPDAGTIADAGTVRPDAGALDAGVKPDAGSAPDAGEADAGSGIADAGAPLGTPDGGEGEVLGSGRTPFIQACSGTAR